MNILKIYTFGLIIFTSTILYSQGPIPIQPGGVLNGIGIEEHIPTKRVIPYEFVREADITWSKRVWMSTISDISGWTASLIKLFVFWFIAIAFLPRSSLDVILFTGRDIALTVVVSAAIAASTGSTTVLAPPPLPPSTMPFMLAPETFCPFVLTSFTPPVGVFRSGASG